MILFFVTVLCWLVGTTVMALSLSGPWWMLVLGAGVLGLPLVARPKENAPAVADASHRDLEQDHMLARLEQRYVAMPDPDWDAYEREVEAVLSGEAQFEEQYRRKVDRELQKKRITVHQARTMRRLSKKEKQAFLDFWNAEATSYWNKPRMRWPTDEEIERMRKRHDL